TLLDEPAAEQAALPEFAAVALAEVGMLAIELKDAVEGGAAELKALFDRGIVAFQFRIVGRRRRGPHGGTKTGPSLLAFCADVRRTGEPRRSATGVGEVKVTGLRSEESGAASDVRVAEQHNGVSLVGRGA